MQKNVTEYKYRYLIEKVFDSLLRFWCLIATDYKYKYMYMYKYIQTGET